MAAELATPVDEFTGIPLPIIDRKDSDSRFAPYLHHPFHPKRDHRLLGVGGQAVRNCRVQLVSYGVHHYDYHQRYVGPPLPTETPDQLRLVVLTTAGYIPQRGLAFDDAGKPKVVTLNEEQRAHLWDRKQMRVGLRKSVHKFLLEQTIKQDFSGVNESTIDEFLHTKDYERRWQLGNTLLGIGAYQATEGLRPIYNRAYKAELIAPEHARSVSRFVLSTLGFRRHRDKIYSQLQARLAAEVA